MKIFLTDSLLKIRKAEAFIIEMGKDYVTAELIDCEVDNISDWEPAPNDFFIDFGDYINSAPCKEIEFNKNSNMLIVRFNPDDISNVRKYRLVHLNERCTLTLTHNFRQIDIVVMKLGFNTFEFKCKAEINDNIAGVLQINTRFGIHHFDCTVMHKNMDKADDGNYIYNATFSDIAIRQRESDLLYDIILKYSKK